MTDVRVLPVALEVLLGPRLQNLRLKEVKPTVQRYDDRPYHMLCGHAS